MTGPAEPSRCCASQGLKAESVPLEGGPLAALRRARPPSRSRRPGGGLRRRGRGRPAQDRRGRRGAAASGRSGSGPEGSRGTCPSALRLRPRSTASPVAASDARAGARARRQPLHGGARSGAGARRGRRGRDPRSSSPTSCSPGRATRNGPRRSPICAASSPAAATCSSSPRSAPASICGSARRSRRPWAASRRKLRNASAA